MYFIIAIQCKGGKDGGAVKNLIALPHPMKPKPYHPIRELRNILDQTQSELAVTLGISKDAVVSWENGRNPLSPAMGRRIALVTGVDETTLHKTKGPLLTRGTRPKRVFTMEEYERYRKMFWEGTPEELVRRRSGPCTDTLELLLLAAGKADAGKAGNRLAGLLDAFAQWCHQAREDFDLSTTIDAELAKRTREMELTQTHGEWRRMAKAEPGRARMMGFKDDPQKNDREVLTLRVETVPLWAPGEDMRAKMPRGQVDVLRPDPQYKT
jgi:transcriptional regulator with XRE-family HTH domain